MTRKSIQNAYIELLRGHLSGRVGIDKFHFTAEPFHLNEKPFEDESYCEELAQSAELKSIKYSKGIISLNYSIRLIIKDNLVISCCSNVGKLINGHNGNIITDGLDIAHAFAITAETINRFLSIIEPRRAGTMFPMDTRSSGYDARFTQLELAVQVEDPDGTLCSLATRSRCDLKQHPDAYS